MKIKKILIIALIICVPFFTIYLFQNQDALDILELQLKEPEVIGAFFVSTLFLVTAHTIRAYKTKYLTDTIKKTSLKTHVRALFIGYLFNILLPLRLGEFIRAVVLGKGTKMSSAFMFGLVVLDRAVDGIILGLITLFLLSFTSVFNAPEVHGLVTGASVLLLSTGLFLLISLFVIKKQFVFVLNFWHKFSAIFSVDIRDSLRFKMWTLMYGLERVYIPSNLVVYISISIVMWIIYITALAPLVIIFLTYPDILSLVTNSTVSYLGVAAPSGPAHIGSYQTFVQPYIASLGSPDSIRNLLAFAWLLQILPAFVIGLIFVLRTRETLDKPVYSDHKIVQDKLLRDTDLTKDLVTFLEAFFTNNSLSRIMHRFEVDSGSKLVSYFKGGSNAITALVHENDTFLVRKITPIQYKYKLKSQYDWLKDKSKLTKVVNVLSEETADDYYKVDLEYNKEFIPLFEYIHSMPVKKSKKIVVEVFDYLFENIYKVKKQEYRPKDLKKYLENRCLDKVQQAADVNDEIRSLLTYEKLVINGQEYLNLPIIIEKIQNNHSIQTTLATYRKCSIHGDITIDNILASKKSDDFLLIDPTDNENEISGPVFDFGRMTQSLKYGYEFLCRDESKVDIVDNQINFEHSISSDYTELYKKLLTLRKKYLTTEEQSSVLFHTAVLYSRMLTHRVVINPRNAAKFYSMSVVAFNDFVNESKKLW